MLAPKSGLGKSSAGTPAEWPRPHAEQRPLRVLHFVTGGFSGATQVAVDLCLAAQNDPSQSALLVLRRKRTTSPARVQALRDRGLQVRVVSNWSHARTVRELRRIIRDWQADVVFAHGFSDHIWGRKAAVAENVREIFHVEHNSRERYTRRRLKQALALMPQTRASIGVSEGVRLSLIARGYPEDKCIAIPNGVALDKFPEALLPELWLDRQPSIIMASRFGRQKDHASLLRALAILRKRGLCPTLYLAGGGKKWRAEKVRSLTRSLGLREQVEFLGNVADLPRRLASTRIFVLSTHWEGMPLALIEAMAAGCACVASDVSGVREVVQHEQTGLLVEHENPEALAGALQRLLAEPALAERLGRAARKYAFANYDRGRMWQRYKDLLAGPIDPDGN